MRQPIYICTWCKKVQTNQKGDVIKELTEQEYLQLNKEDAFHTTCNPCFEKEKAKIAERKLVEI